MTRFLSPDDIAHINERQGGGGWAGADRAGVESAAARPASGFGDHETFGSVWLKAGALLDGLAGTQHFLDGNKRTAWLSAVSFLRLNGIRIPLVPEIEAEAFVLAVATVHDFGPEKAGEWLQSAHNRLRPGYTQDPRLEYLFLAEDVDASDRSVLTVRGAHLHGCITDVLPVPHHLQLVTRLHWRLVDQGSTHLLRARIADDESDGRVLRQFGDPWQLELTAPVTGGHEHHVDGLIPVIVQLGLTMSMIKPGRSTIVVELDGVEVGRVPVQVTLQQPISWDSFVL